MKIKLYFSILAVMLLTGCRTQSLQPASCENKSKSIAGSWKGDRDFWQITLAENEQIVSANIQLGGVEVIPGQIKQIPTRGGGKGIFKPGSWSLDFCPKTKYMKASIVIEHFYQDTGESAIEGQVTDIFSGYVSDNDSLWKADWYSHYTYLIHLKEGTKELNHVEEDNPEYRGKIIFRKISK